MTRWTLRRRLVVVLIALLGAVAASMGLVSTLALRGSLLDQLDESLLASVSRAVAAQERLALEDLPLPGPPFDEARAGDLPPGLGARGQGAGTLSLSELDGEVLAGYLDQDGTFHVLTDDQVDTLEQVVADGVPRTVELESLGGYRVVATTVQQGGLVVTGLSTSDVTSTVGRYLMVEMLVAAVGIAGAALVGGALVRRELRPLERVAATATRVSGLPLHEGEVVRLERVPEGDTDPATEVGRVGTSLNRLLGHVESALAVRHASETQVRQFVADASHELRTPLASIRGYAELVRRLPDDVPVAALRAMGRVEQESRRMTALVEDMLLLARLDAGRPLDRAEVDITALVLDSVADAHAASPDHVWRLDLAPTDEDGPAPGAGTLIGDEDRLRQVLGNLLANARVHTPPGTTVRTSLRWSPDSVILRVQDDGPGIPPELGPHLFDRFTRGDVARTSGTGTPGQGSTGLGLSIVEAVVRAHGGWIDVQGAPGETAFTVTLPVATG